MSPDDTKNTPSIKPLDNAPYLAKGLLKLSNSKDGQIEAQETMTLCRCGGSNNKPFCDGTHITNGFLSDNKEEGVPDKRDNYVGKEITIHDNRGICSHAAHCTDNLPPVWKLGQEPWIDPDGATVEEIIKTINMCPSGALSYTIKDVEHRDMDSEPEIHVSNDGPYRVRGGVELEGFALGDGASKEHYTLCRCGGSKNKPRCDGTHWYIKFSDEKN
jgi:CDGSH-type Zn-finger protein